MYRMAPASQEIQDMIIADAALTIAFAILLSGSGSAHLAVCAGASGILGFLCINSFVFYLPIAFVAVSLSFILHEYMHKRVAQHYGAIAAFQRSDLGIVITLATSFLGFLMGLPGATVIYASTFTRKQEGYTSIAGPLTNLVVFAVFFLVYSLLPLGYAGGYISTVISTTLFIALWLAFVNMLPIYPLDGSKVLRWNKAVYAVTLILVIALLILVLGFSSGLLFSIGFVLVLSLIMSVFFRGMLFR